mmetsp:Transcript_55307/g.135450  ORF Transcript_55307/g.135450 Transcript_55307/m.135450 type:complete len:97 (-) Transcript_55307:114-404(-)
MQHLMALQLLELRCMELGAREGHALGATLRHLTALQSVDLSHIKLGEEGGKAVVSLVKHLPALARFEMRESGICKRVATGLSTLLSNVGLGSVWIS